MMRLTHAQIDHFDLVPPSIAYRVRFYRVPFLWAGGVTLRNTVLLRKGLHGSSDRLIAHELVHVQQWHRQGTVGFLSWYLGDYFRLRWEGFPHRVAYWRMSAERGARHVTQKWADRKGLMS